jgi:hypothetical protein
MGREPFSFGQRITVDGQPYVTGLPTLAVVVETCGAGCGMVGAADIEIGQAIWEQTYRCRSDLPGNWPPAYPRW